MKDLLKKHGVKTETKLPLKFQLGGPAPEAAPMEQAPVEAGGNPAEDIMMMLEDYRVSPSPELAVQIVESILATMPAAPAPTFRKGGKAPVAKSDKPDNKLMPSYMKKSYAKGGKTKKAKYNYGGVSYTTQTK